MATTQNFEGNYHLYPVFSTDQWATGGGLGFEGAQKRFTTLPTPREVYDAALMGLPKTFPLTGEPITPDHLKPYLDSAITELEMTAGFDISPVERDEPFDYIQGSFTNNYSGFKLTSWPATKIVAIELRFPHAVTTQRYMTYQIPAPWVALKRNKVNIVASFGAVSIDSAQNPATAAGIYNYITGFAYGSYAPAIISIKYVSGFENDRVPTVLADLIKTWAAWRFLGDAVSTLFPTGSVSVSIDGVSQSSSNVVASALGERLKTLDTKRQQQMAAIKKAFGRSLAFGVVGA